MSRVLFRVGAWLALVLTAGLLTHASPATATPPPALQVVSHGPTLSTPVPVPGAFLTADLGTWNTPPSSYEFEWLRDEVPIPGATSQDYDILVSDVGHRITPRVTGKDGNSEATFTGDPVVIRKIASSLTLDVRRVHPPGKNRLAWTAITYLSMEPGTRWPTDGGTITAFKEKDGRLKELGRATVTRGAAFVWLPWKRAPAGKTRVLVCFAGNEGVDISCSPYDVVRRGHSRR